MASGSVKVRLCANFCEPAHTTYHDTNNQNLLMYACWHQHWSTVWHLALTFRYMMPFTNDRQTCTCKVSAEPWADFETSNCRRPWTPFIWAFECCTETSCQLLHFHIFMSKNVHVCEPLFWLCTHHYNSNFTSTHQRHDDLLFLQLLKEMILRGSAVKVTGTLAPKGWWVPIP